MREIARLWMPLAFTWLIMAVEGPFLTAVIARLPDPAPNLAAYGVAFAIAILVESPVIMMLSASTALVDSPEAFKRMRAFAHATNAAVTAAMGVVLIPWVFRRVVGVMGLDAQVARLTSTAVLCLLPWPGAIGYRRFYQGLLVRAGLTRRVAYGTVVRLCAMACAALLLRHTGLQGAWVGACALSAGVCAEALATRIMASGTRNALARQAASPQPAPTYAQIGSFYAPLALTMVLAMASSPMVTFFLGTSKYALESLAVVPVVNGLVFLFRTFGVSLQEVCVALLATRRNSLRPLLTFTTAVAALTSGGLAVVGWTPLADLWFLRVSGLSQDLLRFATTAARIQFPLPALGALQSLQRAVLIHARRTRPVTAATVVELAGIAACLLVTVKGVGMVGATAAAWALVVGRALGNASLLLASLKAARRAAPEGAPPA